MIYTSFYIYFFKEFFKNLMYRLEISLCKEKCLRRIETVEFIKMRDQLVELFPTEDKDIFYIPAHVYIIPINL